MELHSIESKAFSKSAKRKIPEIFLASVYSIRSLRSLMRGEEQNREEGEMAQKKLGGGRNRGGK